jgi:DNA polymerase III subunit delta
MVRDTVVWQSGGMAAYVISGDESLIGLELTTLVDRLVGDNDRTLMVDDFDCADTNTTLGAIADSLTTMPLFTERRIVVVRNVHSLDAQGLDTLVEAIDARVDEVDTVATITGRQPKVFSDAMKRAGAESIGASVGTGFRDRIEWVEVHLVEAGLTYAPDVARLISNWLGGDQSRLAGLIQTLISTYGENAKLTRTDVEVFLGEAGSVAPWDLTDAIDEGDTPRALVMLHRFMNDGDTHALQVLSLLANRYAQMMKLDGRGVRSAADAVAILGGKEFTAKKVLEQYQRLGGSGVARAVAHIANADVDLRGGKEWPDVLVLEILVGRLCQLVPNRGARKPAGRR